MKNKKYKKQKSFYEPVFRTKVTVELEGSIDSVEGAKITSKIKNR